MTSNIQKFKFKQKYGIMQLKPMIINYFFKDAKSGNSLHCIFFMQSSIQAPQNTFSLSLGEDICSNKKMLFCSWYP